MAKVLLLLLLLALMREITSFEVHSVYAINFQRRVYWPGESTEVKNLTKARALIISLRFII